MIELIKKSKIDVRLAGGLGNQIFQFGAAVLLARQHDIETIECSFGALSSYDVPREFSLGKIFNLSSENVEFTSDLSWVFKLRLAKLGFWGLPRGRFGSDSNFLDLLNDKRERYWLDGYFQDCLSPEMFGQLSFVLRGIKHPTGLGYLDGCVLHIRGGDFVNSEWSSTNSRSYYERAVRKMGEDFGITDFVVVTDDIPFAQELLRDFGSVGMTFESGDMLSDFHKIGLFRYRILSSSTFAFWASALGDVTPSAVLSPADWSPGRRRMLRVPGELDPVDGFGV